MLARAGTERSFPGFDLVQDGSTEDFGFVGILLGSFFPTSATDPLPRHVHGPQVILLRG